MKFNRDGSHSIVDVTYIVYTSLDNKCEQDTLYNIHTPIQ